MERRGEDVDASLARPAGLRLPPGAGVGELFDDVLVRLDARRAEDDVVVLAARFRRRDPAWARRAAGIDRRERFPPYDVGVRPSGFPLSETALPRRTPRAKRPRCSATLFRAVRCPLRAVRGPLALPAPSGGGHAGHGSVRR